MNLALALLLAQSLFLTGVNAVGHKVPLTSSSTSDTTEICHTRQSLVDWIVFSIWLRKNSLAYSIPLKRCLMFSWRRYLIHKIHKVPLTSSSTSDTTEICHTRQSLVDWIVFSIWLRKNSLAYSIPLKRCLMFSWRRYLRIHVHLRSLNRFWSCKSS